MKEGGGRLLFPAPVYRGMVAESGVSGKCTKTEVYPTAVRSGLKSLTDGVMTWLLTKDPECGVPAVTDGRRDMMEAEP